ncbi:GatB/YqeY domain-containing protein [Patescibacteria group bacterium]|nr:MAG: GatB/YqeY domain-containing protein [Patescibacteria group bacterium]
MSLIDTINQDLTAALKEQQADRVQVLRLIKTAFINEKIKLGHDLGEPEALKVLQREAKQRRDSIDQYRAGGRDDLADSEQQELAIIEGYLPQQLSQSELDDLVSQVISELKPSGPAQMGQVIGEVVKRASGRTDGAAVSAAVRAKLQ